MPDTTAYMFLGLVVIAVIMGALMLSIVMRYRNADQEEKMLEQLASED